MPYRGMSYSRGGSYRRNEGSSWRGSSRGGMSRVDNGGSRHFESSPYESSRSSSRSYFQSHERYQPSRPREESYHRESYRPSQVAEYTRDYSRGSPDPPRKRMRTEASYSMASSRRSDDRRFSSSASYGSRSHYMSEKPIGGYSMDKSSSFRESRESRPNEHSYRKSGVSLPRSRVSQRGRSFASSSRVRGRGQTRPSAFTRRRAVEARRYVSTKSNHYLRRLQNYKLKRALKRGQESDDEAADLDNLDLEEKDSDIEKNDEADQSGRESEAKETDEKDATETEEKKEIKEDSKESEKRSSKKSPKRRKTESDNEAVNAADDEGLNFISLKCPQCKFSCTTFMEYKSHLTMGRHQKSMKLVAGAIRTKLVKMRSDQRLQQRELDNEAEGIKHLRTFFCGVCKLNYRTLKSDHQATPAHKKMQDFLQPYCKICKITCRSPMMYESHICDLRHIKRKAKLERIRAFKKDEELGEIDPNAFMVVDAVGSGDESGSSETKEGPADRTPKMKELKKEVKKRAESRGTEFCKLIQVYYCEICRKYLPRLDDKDRALNLHCRSTMHLIRFSQEMKLQRRRAHLSKKVKNESPPKKAPPKDEVKELLEFENTPKDEDKHDTEGSDKKWLMVENDLDELLQVKKFSDEEEPGSPESDRCGRFKHGEEDGEGAEKNEKKAEDTSASNATAVVEGIKVEEDA